MSERREKPGGMKEWVVAGGIVEGPDGLLLVRNERRWGSSDWSPPGGVIDDTDADVVSGLTREVFEETGITVTDWHGPVYEVVAEAVEMGWRMRAQVFVAHRYEGDLRVDDPDGIVVDAAFVDRHRRGEMLADCHPWVREPLGEWMEERWDASTAREYRYHLHGSHPREISVERL